MLHIRERGKDLSRGKPVEGTHGEKIVLSVPDSKLLLEILEGIEAVRSVEILVVLAVAAFNFTVVSGSIGADQLVTNTQLLQCFLK